MKRHRRLVPLSHDHHHALVEARRLQSAAGGNDRAVTEAATAFLQFFREETVKHFREEEEFVFPLVVKGDVVPDLVLEALAQHVRIHARVQRMEQQLVAGLVEADELSELGKQLHDHVRFEERQLFPLVEQDADRERLDTLSLPSATEATLTSRRPENA